MAVGHVFASKQSEIFKKTTTFTENEINLLAEH